jgi:hypothetical protein
MHADGLPVDLFTSGEVRWLGIQVGTEAEQQPRVLLVSVPYALKAGDAETLGGKPASAYMLSDSQTDSTSPGSNAGTGAATAAGSGKNQKARTASTSPRAPVCSSVTGNAGGAVNSIAMFDAACDIQSSNISQAGSNVGIGTPSPTYALDITSPSNASVRLSGSGSHQFTIAGATSGRLGEDAAGFFFSSDTSGGAVRFLTNNGSLHEWMRVTSAGNVGIGTLTPASRLDVAGEINAASSGASTTITGTYAGTAFDAVDGLATSGTGATAGVFGSSASNAGTGVYGYAGAASGTTYGLYGQAVSTNGVGVFGTGGKWAGSFIGNVYASGSVGIGTSAPAHMLDVGGEINAISAGSNTTITGTYAGTTYDAIDGLATNGTGATAGVFGASASTAGTGVYGYAGAATGTTYGVYGQSVSNNGVGVFGQGSKWAGYFQGDVFANGNVGIGTATPSSKLEVNGTAKFDGIVTFANTQVFPHGAIFTGTSLFNNFPSIDPAFVRVSGNSSPGAIEAYRASVIPAACTAANLTVVLSGSANIMVILRKNLAPTTLACTISSATSCTDNVHTISLAAGDLLSLEITGGSTGTVVYTAFSCG